MKTIARTQAFAAIIAAVEACRIPGMETHSNRADTAGGSLLFSWERTWTVGCRLTIQDRPEGLRAFVSWSSTDRSASSARAAVALYSAVTDLACLIESTWEGYETTDA